MKKHKKLHKVLNNIQYIGLWMVTITLYLFSVLVFALMIIAPYVTDVSRYEEATLLIEAMMFFAGGVLFSGIISMEKSKRIEDNYSFLCGTWVNITSWENIQGGPETLYKTADCSICKSEVMFTTPLPYCPFCGNIMNTKDLKPELHIEYKGPKYNPTISNNKINFHFTED